MMNINEALCAVKRQPVNIFYLRAYINEEFPNMSKALRLIDMENTRRCVPKGYNLTKVENKRLGFVYYVRYWHEKRMLPSKWCTHTNDYAAACEFAQKNRGRLIKNYLKNNDNEVEKFFKNYYDKECAVYRLESARNGELAEVRREISHSFMRKKFVPFLKSRTINRFDEITVPVLDDLQDKLLAEGIKPQTVNDNIGMVGKAFKYLVRKGLARENPCAALPALRIKPGDKRTHGCHEVVKMRGIFDKVWDDKLSYILNLLVHTTDMRNSEIMSIKKSDIVEHHGVRFVDVKRSKSASGVRLVPLHPFVYRKLTEYAAGMVPENTIFGDISAYRFTRAYKALAVRLGVDEATLKKENITYYSGRHYWKTLMSAEGLGEDIEEVFMGHKVSGDVSKLYNHREAAGRKRVVEKAREVFKILDRRLFNIKAV